MVVFAISKKVFTYFFLMQETMDALETQELSVSEGMICTSSAGGKASRSWILDLPRCRGWWSDKGGLVH